MRSLNRMLKATTLVLISVSSAILAQDTQKPVVSFSFVNAIGSENPTFLFLNEVSYRPKGYPAGAVTDGGMLYPGKYRIKITNEGSKDFEQAIDVQAHRPPKIIAFLKRAISSDGKETKQVACLPIPQMGGKVSEPVFVGVYVGAEGAIAATVNGAACRVPASEFVTLTTDSQCTIETNTKKRSFSPQDAGRFIIVFFENQGKTDFTLIKDNEFVEYRGEGE
jgi:hypothetical protein